MTCQRNALVSSSMGEEFYNRGLDKNRANFTPLSPVAFLRRAADVHPKRVSLVSEDRQFTWEETRERCCQFSRALLKRGIKRNDTVWTTRTFFWFPMSMCASNAYFGCLMDEIQCKSVNEIHRTGNPYGDSDISYP